MGIFVARRFLGLFCFDASGTLIQDWMFMVHLWDPFHILLSIEQVIVARVAKSLMPEKALHFNLNGGNRCVALDVLMERDSMYIAGKTFHLLA